MTSAPRFELARIQRLLRTARRFAGARTSRAAAKLHARVRHTLASRCTRIGWAVLCMGMALAAPALADQAACAALHDGVPQRIDAFRLMGTRVYEDPAAGFAAQYEDRNGGRLSVFHYLGARDTAQGVDLNALMRVEMGRVVAYVREQGLIPTPAFRLGLSATGNPVAAQQGFVQAPELRDIIVLGTAQGCLVKLRYTGPTLEVPQIRRFWQAVAGDPAEDGSP